MRRLTDPAAFLADLVDDPPTALERHGGQMPELAALRGCPQPANHHSEGDVWAHTLLALSVLADLPAAVERWAGEALAEAGLDTLRFPPRTAAQGIAVLLHDVAKPVTIAGRDGAWTYYGHDRVGADLAAGIIEREGLAVAIPEERVRWLVREHLFWLNTDVERVTDRAVARRFVRDDGWDEDLRVLAWCDTLGSRGTGGRPHVDLLVAAEARLAATRHRAAAPPHGPARLLDGHEVMDVLGLEPGSRVGAVLTWLDHQDVRSAGQARRLLTLRREWLRTADERALRA